MHTKPDINIDQLWQAYKDQLRQFLHARINNSADVDDVLQEILIKSYQKLDTVQQPSKVQSWLFQIARNTLIDYYRKSRADLTDIDIDRLSVGSEDTEEYEQTRQELSRCLRPFLSQLPDKYREAITLVDFQGISQKALAHEQGLSHSAVKSRVQRGRKMLGELVTDCCRYQVDARGNPISVEVKTVGCQCCQSC
jgi:RNA polymerase sigma-70 factor (ECF subfamily)